MAKRIGKCGHPTTSQDPDGICGSCYQKRPSKGRTLYKARICGHDTPTKYTDRCITCYKTHRRESAVGRPRPGFALPVSADQAAREAHQRERTKALEKAYREAIKDRTDEEAILRLFESSITRFPELPRSVFTASTAKARQTKSTEEPVLCIGDQQIGEVISHDETGGINEYNFDIFQQRLAHLEDRVVDLLVEHHNATFKRLTILSLGDNVSGLIHDELQKWGHQHIIDQCYLGALCMALFVYRLRVRLAPRGIEEIVVSGVSGNHGRVQQKKEFKQYYKNFDYLFHNIMATVLRDVQGIRFLIPRSLWTLVDVAGHRILQSHGHELPPSSLGIPLYSINRASAGYQELLAWRDDSRFDYWVMGHFHRPLDLDNSMVNGTMAGLGEMGIGKFKPIRPSQRIFGMHEKWGQTWDYKIRLDKAEGAGAYTFSADMATADALELFAERTTDGTHRD